MSQIYFGGWLLVSVVAVGCATDDEAALDQIEQSVQAPNGVSLNGVSLNGVGLNGVSLNGVSLNGVSLNGVSLNGGSIGVSSTGQPLTGVEPVGSTWTARLSNGDTLPLRIDSASQGTGTNVDVWMYAISYQTTSQWTPLCGTDGAGAPILALSVDGTWNQQSGVAGGGAYSPTATSFTLACRGKSIAKCVELGYKPWKGFAKQLASCVRLLRGDFCGDGTPYTIDGHLVNLYDNVGVQRDTEAWVVEAEWTPNGARCISSKRATRFYEAAVRPTCFESLPQTTACGTTFRNGAVLIDEIP